nr:hypothetical protein Q903MT_gene4996 [Picea sitchensis]
MSCLYILVFAFSLSLMSFILHFILAHLREKNQLSQAQACMYMFRRSLHIFLVPFT